ncbi:MAG: VWA domain-containing protein [Ruminococcus sp.]|nr:VWA domain-containing protein [Ruminococcus sp.]
MSKKVLLVIIPIIVLIIGALVVLAFVSDHSDTQLCMQEVSNAEKCISEGDFQNAVLCYNKAIEADKKQEEPYLGLASLYYQFNDIESAITVLRMGVENAGTTAIQTALNTYLGYQNADVPAQDNEADVFTTAETRFNDYYISRFASYSYSDYSSNFTIKDETIRSGIYTVSYLNIDAQFIYKNSDERELLDSNGRPFYYARPSEIVINNLDVIMNATDSTTIDDLKEYGALNLRTKNKGDVKAVTFSYSNCEFSLEANADGTLIHDSKNNKVYPQPAEREVPSETQTVSTAKIDVVFTVDTSGSMSSDIDVAQDSMYEFVKALDKDDRAGLVEFNTNSSILCPLTADKSKVNSKIGSLSTTGGTAMYKGLSNALSLFDGQSDAYKMIIILSDGYDSSSSYNSDYAGLVSQAVSNNVVVYTVGIGSSVDTTLLVQIASATGGQYYNAADSSEILRIFDDIQNQEIVVNNSARYSAGDVAQKGGKMFAPCAGLNKFKYDEYADKKVYWLDLIRG